ncbi:OmpH/Skp family outer membrane protein [Wolbachia endosymbiont of Dirofilaria (Dirofilaria) immitis]|uniref:OmpH family outer membrane protein n=1 Tax=Wolbachia endosymbiont of Dirofilaria (Dirofilaria) immitis TaxID=1812115 RepID=UPI00158E43D6|nr:OmpH family outer membrane protein [Wolbachia endosymbiont of Dirofilaria (Dirofilaria) immitis]QKX02564.1 OmpH family outer membrane protein [Wolbachia endosymbiont of Dirofilaria (Dirofilaria) immitis]
MKYTQLLISVIALVISVFSSYKAVKQRPQDAFNTKVVIVDSDKVINESLALRNIQQKIKEQSSKLQQEFENELEKFKSSKEEFELLSEEAKKEKADQFNKHAVSVKDDYAKKMSHLEESYRDAIEDIFNKVKEVARKTAEENSIDLVLFLPKKNQILYSIDKVDLSDILLRSINKEVCECTLKDIN